MIQIIDIYPDMCDVRGDTQANVWNGGNAYVHEGGTAAGPGEIEWEEANDESN